MLVLRHCRQLIACAGPAPRRGAAQSQLEIIAGGAVAIAAGRILYAGSTADLDHHVDVPAGARVIDARDVSVVPGFVDGHTHAVFAGDRRQELQRRLAGESYASIAATGGGIVSTVSATRLATADD